MFSLACSMLQLCVAVMELFGHAYVWVKHPLHPLHPHSTPHCDGTRITMEHKVPQRDVTSCLRFTPVYVNKQGGAKATQQYVCSTAGLLLFPVLFCS